MNSVMDLRLLLAKKQDPSELTIDDDIHYGNFLWILGCLVSDIDGINELLIDVLLDYLGEKRVSKVTQVNISKPY